MDSLKIIHIFTDSKFIYDSNRFNGEKFDNSIIILSNKVNKNVYNDYSTLIYKFSLKNFSTIIKRCKKSDIVVLYDLDFIKAYIANRLPVSVKVIWRFFGSELYDNIPEYVYTTQTIEASFERKRFDILYLRNKFTILFNLLRFRTNFKKEFESAAFNRVDYFHGLSEKEYQFLKKFWPKLPPFLQISFNQYVEINNYKLRGSRLIIIGNNRSAFNNHLDTIDLIRKSSQKSKFQFLMLFSYGQNNAYTTAVRTKAAEVKEIEVLEDFLPMDKLVSLYSEAGALVINGHREMAMFNIFLAIHSNTKVYLNEKNIILDWLKEEGFLVYSINDFIADLDLGNTELKEEEAISNQKQFIKFSAKYNHQEFHNSLLKYLNYLD